MEAVSVIIGSSGLGNSADEDFYYDWISFVKDNIAKDYPNFKFTVISRQFGDNQPDKVVADNEDIKADILDWLNGYGWNMFCSY